MFRIFRDTVAAVHALAVIIDILLRDRVYAGIMRTWDNRRANVVGKTIDRQLVYDRPIRCDRSGLFHIFDSKSRRKPIRHIGCSFRCSAVKQLHVWIIFFSGIFVRVFKVPPPLNDHESSKPRAFSKTSFCAARVIIYAHRGTETPLSRRINIEISIFEPLECSRGALSCRSSMSFLQNARAPVLLSLLIRAR